VKANLGDQQLSKWKGRPTTGFSLTQKTSAILLQVKCFGWFFVQLILSVTLFPSEIIILNAI